ncbi:hypothetical protein IHE45_07G071200 [Dioscorea alata]|uniref:Uncharacterized protein n=1 Tax=Dioscorea alata TaxID=55571 RepID=A0ACB7VS64_DIOAL|nr:hypothetical protein IHE45_07G071200 [Dioscorea alata]
MPRVWVFFFFHFVCIHFGRIYSYINNFCIFRFFSLVWKSNAICLTCHLHLLNFIFISKVFIILLLTIPLLTIGKSCSIFYLLLPVKDKRQRVKVDKLHSIHGCFYERLPGIIL